MFFERQPTLFFIEVAFQLGVFFQDVIDQCESINTTVSPQAARDFLRNEVNVRDSHNKNAQFDGSYLRVIICFFCQFKACVSVVTRIKSFFIFDAIVLSRKVADYAELNFPLKI